MKRIAFISISLFVMYLPVQAETKDTFNILYSGEMQGQIRPHIA
jgi:hypothetical protein